MLFEIFYNFAVKEKSFKKTYKSKNQLEIYLILINDYRMHFNILLENYRDNKKY